MDEKTWDETIAVDLKGANLIEAGIHYANVYGAAFLGYLRMELERAF